MSDSQPWYMSIGGHQVGPVIVQEMISNIRSGSLQPESYICAPGMKD